MSISLKLGLSFLAMICGIVGLGYFSSLRIADTAAYIGKIYSNPLQSISYARAAQNDFGNLSSERRIGALTHHENAKQVDEDYQTFLSDLGTAKERAISPEGRKAVTTAQDLAEAWRKESSEGAEENVRQQL